MSGAAVELRGPRVVVRPWRRGDEEALVRHADDREVWRTLSDVFPHPYTRETADWWIGHCAAQDPPLDLAVEWRGEAVGGVGLKRGSDLRVRTAELGYWIGRACWGRGLATEAAGLLVDHAFRAHDFARLEAAVLASNRASARVLEKLGFELEARQPRALFKEGRVQDGLLYRKLRPRAAD